MFITVVVAEVMEQVVMVHPEEMGAEVPLVRLQVIREWLERQILEVAEVLLIIIQVRLELVVLEL